MIRTFWARACIAVAMAVLLWPALTGAEAISRKFSLAGVEVAIHEDAVIDWNDPGDAAFEIERDMIRVLFEGAVTDAAAGAMTGSELAALRVSVVRFDILSTLELFFCCAVNEVSARFELIEPETGRALAEPVTLIFDHIGRGGLIGAAAAEGGESQLDRVARIIRSGVGDWIESTE